LTPDQLFVGRKLDDLLRPTNVNYELPLQQKF
jgi:hypothetical protein